MNLIKNQSGRFSSFLRISGAIALFVLCCFPQSEARSDKGSESDHEAKSKPCDLSKNPYCEEIRKATERINERTADYKKFEGSFPGFDPLAYPYADRGELYFKAGNYKEALSDFNRAIDGNSRAPATARLRRGEIFLKQGRLNDALEDFKRSSGAEADQGIGLIHLRQRNYRDAFFYFERAIYRNHRLPQSYYGRGVVYLKKGHEYRENGDETLAVRAYNDALYDFNSVTEILLGKTGSRVYTVLEKVHEALGHEAEAKKNKRLADETKQKEAANPENFPDSGDYPIS
jgi:tetratricopeptide (TPR) repeat protein